MQVQVRLNPKIVVYSVLVLVLLMFPITFVHEFAHGMVCAWDGNKFTISVVGFAGVNTVCHGDLTNYMVYHAAGGIFSVIVTAIPFVKWHWIKDHKHVFIPLMTLMTGELITAIVETFMHESYVVNIGMWSSVMGMVYVLVFSALLIRYGRSLK